MGLRPSEQIALFVDDCDLSHSKLKVSKACVMKRDKDRTKTGKDRIVELCPRAGSAEATVGAKGAVEARWEDRSQPFVLSRGRYPDTGSEPPL